MRADDPAAIIFTTGSTGPPKGVLYCHGNFDQQTTAIADHFGILARGVDLCGFPLFSLFNCALGVTTIFPDMDFSRPAQVDPRNIVEAIRDWHATQSFGSPAMWRRVAQYCQARGIRLPTLRRVISAGAPVAPDLLAQIKGCIAVDGDVHTPYGATEALPVSSITASEVLAETQHRWAQGGGTCIGRALPCIESKVIEINDRPLSCLRDIVETPTNQIGELIVCGPLVTSRYFKCRESNAMAKIADGSRVWHRMGDAVYLDNDGRLWFCGRIAHRVRTPHGTMFTIPCEAIFNQHSSVYRSALVGVGDPPYQRPVIVVETHPWKMPKSSQERRALVNELANIALAHRLTESICDFLVRRSLPVDTRHNAKILRGTLALWAARQLGGLKCEP
jgi:acyl-CoA synthetase (AMP-forming)/AMP-acid ligase II